MKKKRFLAVSGFFPFPPTNGFTLRVSAVLRAFTEAGVEFDLLCFGEPDEGQRCEERDRRICRRIQFVPHRLASLSQASDYLRRVCRLPFAMPHGVARFRSELLRRRISEFLETTAYDGILCETPYMLVNFPEKLSVPLLVDAHNVENCLLLRYLPFENNPIKRYYARIEGCKMAEWERYTFSRCDLALACSTIDRDAIKRLSPTLPVAVVPNTINLESYIPGAPGDSRTILYLGGMDWFPNRDAVQYFVYKILPLIRVSVPDAKFLVAGRSPSPGFRRQFDGVRDVEFTGTLPDLRPAIVAAAVIVVPLRVGGGTRFKIIEAGAMEKPIVSTSLGAEGLDFIDGEEIILADQPSGFAKAVVELLEHPERGARLARAARTRTAQDYGQSALARSVEKALDQLCTMTLASGASRAESAVIVR